MTRKMVSGSKDQGVVVLINAGLHGKYMGKYSLTSEGVIILRDAFEITPILQFVGKIDIDCEDIVLIHLSVESAYYQKYKELLEPTVESNIDNFIGGIEP